ncbi:PREDICTED: uncharacterized protein LOC104811119 [Tarenaya hassleriana]|uniref:uncharacterized protein LOC104811119 n=1 Tax=Tarenaya hassleriana TaxID=28532 RepID=UPI00053C0AA0|nr:PREDICTED: uncharacterized protein LOC104811119 [Tarenaya hassleriana]
MSLPSLPPVDMPFNMPSNQNVFSSRGDEPFDFAVLSHLNQSLVTNQMNAHQPMFLHNSQMSRSFDYLSSNNHVAYANISTFSKQEPNGNMVLSSCSSSSSSSSSPIIFSQNPRGFPSLGPNNQFELGRRMAQHMRRNIVSISPPRTQVSSFVDYSPIKDNPNMTRVSITETITKQYSAVIPASSVIPIQNDIQRVKRALACESSIWHSPSNDLSSSQNVIGEQSIDDDRANLRPEILTAEPLSTVFPQGINQNHRPWPQRETKPDNLSSRSHKDPIYPESLNPSSAPPDNRDKRKSSRGFRSEPSRGKKARPSKKIEDIVGYFFNYSEEEDGYEDDDAYDGRTHSLPYAKYGPYTCPKCNTLFDTSQKFAAHMVSVHYKNETGKEKRKRLRARYKKQFRQLNLEVPGVKHDVSGPLEAEKEIKKTDLEVEKEERVAGEEEEDAAASSKGTRDGDGFLHDVVVKQELM